MIVTKTILLTGLCLGFSWLLNAQEAGADIMLQEVSQPASTQLSSSWWPWGKATKDSQKSDADVKHKKDKKGLKDKNKQESLEGDNYRWLQAYADIVGLLEEKSYCKIEFATFIQNSLKAALAGIDAHSSFFSPDSFKLVQESTSGEFSGIGVSINGKTLEDEALAVVDVIDGGPAAKAGLHPGDRILQVDGAALRGLSTDEVVGKLKGKVGTKVVIKVLRSKKKPLNFTITRDIVKDQTALCYCFNEQSVYYLSLKIFNELAAGQMENLLVKANEGKCNGLILDLRRNPGGTMDSAIAMAGLFLEKGSLVVSTKNKQGKLMSEYRTNRSPVLKSDVPIFILIDNFTASASEILAGALKHHSEKSNGKNNLRVFLVGTTTFGKGSVQELIPVKNGCAIKITTMLYYLPDDSSIQAKGIAPDFIIKPKSLHEEEMQWVKELYGQESSLKNHIKAEGAEDPTGIKKNSSKDDKKNNKKEDKKEEKKGLWQRLMGGKDEPSSANQVQSNDEQEGNSEDGVDKTKDGKTLEEKQREAIALDVQIQASVNMINILRIAKKADHSLIKTRAKELEFLKKNYLTDTVSSVEKVK